MAGQLSWLERGANNAKVAGSIPVRANFVFENNTKWKEHTKSSVTAIVISKLPFEAYSSLKNLQHHISVAVFFIDS